MPYDVSYQALPPERAILYLRQKLGLPTRAWRDLVGAMHDRAFVVAGAVKMQLVEDLHAAVLRALEEGRTLEDFRKDFDRIVQAHGWSYRGSRGWRTSVIYRTNLRTAHAAGRYEQMRSPEVLAARPYWLYRHGGSRVPRPDHLSWDGLVLAATDPWWETHYPPNGWGCSCLAFSLSASEVKRRGLKIARRAPRDGTYEYTVPETGEVVDLPAGVGYGWDHAPGRAWLESLTPRALESWPAGADRIPIERRWHHELGPVEAPAPRPLASDILLQDGLPPEEYFAAFAGELGLGADGGVLLDVLGETLAITRRLFTERGGRDKTFKTGRHRYVRALARTLADPDEIWVQIVPLGETPGQYRVVRHYLAWWRVGDDERSALAGFTWTGDHWIGVTAFPPTSTDTRRRGIRIYRRPTERP